MDASHLPQPPSSTGTPRRTVNLAHGPRESAGQGLDLIEIVNVLKRRKMVIFAAIALVMTISASIVFQITPRYTAEAAIILDERKTQVVDVQAVLSGLPFDAAVVRSELEVLKSPALADAVVKKLDLASIAEFNPRLHHRSALAPVGDAVRWVEGQVASFFGAAAPLPPPADRAEAEILAAGRLLQKHTQILNDGRSYVLKIRVDCESPHLAAMVANAYADAYLTGQLEAKFEAVRRANAWLNDRLAELRTQVEITDRAVEEFKGQHNLVDAKGVTVTSQQITELNTQLVLAAADRAQKEAALHQVQEQLKSGGVSAAAQVLGSPLIQRLREQETDLRQQEAQLATKYKPAHPAMLNVKAQEKDLEEKINSETDKIVRGMEGDVSASRAREGSLRDSLQNLQKSSAKEGQTEVQLRELDRQAESNRTLYENFLNRFKQTSAQQDIQQADARIIAPAQDPTTPSYPRTGLLLEMAFAGSILLGIVGAIGVERLDNGFRTGEQFEKLTQVPMLGLVPNFKTDEEPHDTVLTHPVSPYAEAIRTIRTSLRYSDVDSPPKVVLVTSALPDEGKSVFSLSLARSVAFSGSRALLIDCDLRRPSVASLLKADPNPGILALFEEGADLKTALRLDEKSGMHFIPSTTRTANPQDLLGSKQMRALLERLRDKYDLIVLDTPPVLAVSDSLVLSHLADTTIFLARWGKTARPVVLGALKAFTANGGDLAGVVLSRVDFKRHAAYGYGDSGYYYGYYGKQYGGYSKS